MLFIFDSLFFQLCLMAVYITDCLVRIQTGVAASGCFDTKQGCDPPLLYDPIDAITCFDDGTFIIVSYKVL